MSLRTKKNYWQQDFKKKEYIAAFLEGLGIMSVIGYLFYQSMIGILVLMPISIWYVKKKKKMFEKKRQTMFKLQFREAIQALLSALNVGYAMENAMREALKELRLIYKKEDMIIKEFEYMNHKIRMNLPAEEVWKAMAQKIDSEEVHNFVAVFVTAKRNGGDMLEILRSSIRQISEKIDVLNEIETLLAAKKLEFKIMTMIPMGIILYMRISFPEFMNALYGTVMGAIVMSACLIVYFAAYKLGEKIVEIEV